jgi:hypothetical protein
MQVNTDAGGQHLNPGTLCLNKSMKRTSAAISSGQIALTRFDN